MNISLQATTCFTRNIRARALKYQIPHFGATFYTHLTIPKHHQWGGGGEEEVVAFKRTTLPFKLYDLFLNPPRRWRPHRSGDTNGTELINHTEHTGATENCGRSVR